MVNLHLHLFIRVSIGTFAWLILGGCLLFDLKLHHDKKSPLYGHGRGKRVQELACMLNLESYHVELDMGCRW